jgi:hypothetical protein
MDILNFISWIKGGRVVNTVDPAKTLLPVGLKDNRRDDAYLAGAITVEDFTTQVADVARPYKVYTALLTQSGGSTINNPTQGDVITQGVTYLININSDNADLTVFGAPNNNIGTYFVCTTSGTLPMQGSIELQYNTGAPVATVLENTIGNVWFSYEGVGYYSANSYVLFTPNKTYQNPVNYNLPNDITEGYSFVYQDDSVINLLVFQGGTTQDSSLLNTPIEIRVYN